ncbi:hypothetical protein DL98DRAFT_416727 [Cadophora sp. DSE1049]|nr:hypothetical protein DL98DRAFT_416727 [Cadophora sp. DSE1049]
MDTQLDELAIKDVLVPLKTNLLSLLKSRILAKKKEYCHACYHGCKTILAYFHFASGGAAPLSLDWDSAAEDTSILSPDQIAYLRGVKRELLNQDADLRAIKNSSMYETEMYWCHQMLLQNWKADMPHTGKLLEYTESDFLVA